MLLNNNMYAPMPLLPNPFVNSVAAVSQPQASLGLNQIKDFSPVKEFTDESNTPWRLVKEAANSTVDVPDPKSLQIVDYWNHAFPGKNNLYCYVVEGVKQPRVETEQATRILYLWFSPVFVQNFTPQMISDREWLKAHVYAAPVLDARMSKLNALCKIQDTARADAPAEENKLLYVDGISNGTTAQGTEAQN